MNINAIIVTPLPRIQAIGGDVLKVLKFDESSFASFGEAYFSLVDSLAIKAWKRHNQMTLNLVVPIGKVRFVFADTNSYGEFTENFKVIEIGLENYSRITVPPGIWFGFQGLMPSPNLILNIGDLPHDPSEVDLKNLEEVPFNWGKFI
jgi:dTDP-4-dehydrorhamnose 3,5-epimerase